MLNNLINLTSDFVANNLPEYYIGFLSAIFILYLIKKSWEFSVNSHKYYISRADKKLKRLLMLQELNTDPQLNAIIKEKIDNFIFYQTSGISASNEERKVILSVKERYNIDLIHFKQAYELYNIENGNLSIRITFWNKLERVFVCFLMVASFVLSVFSLGVGMFLGENWIITSIYYILAIIFIFAGAIVSTQNRKFISVKIIQDKILSAE